MMPSERDPNKLKLELKIRVNRKSGLLPNFQELQNLKNHPAECRIDLRPQRRHHVQSDPSL